MSCGNVDRALRSDRREPKPAMVSCPDASCQSFQSQRKGRMMAGKQGAGDRQLTRESSTKPVEILRDREGCKGAGGPT